MEELVTYGLVFAAVLAVVFAAVMLVRESDGTGWRAWLGPKWIARYRARRRKDLFEAKIIDLTMGLANAMKAGMALPQALDKVGAQMGGVMAEEISTVLREYRLGMSITDAIARLTERMPCEDMRLLTSAIRLTMQTGGSLVEVLAEMVDMIRNRTEFHQKLKTLTAQGKFEALAMASAPIAAFFILYLCQPDLMQPLVTTATGWAAIAVALVLESIGFIVVKKIITIEV